MITIETTVPSRGMVGGLLPQDFFELVEWLKENIGDFEKDWCFPKTHTNFLIVGVYDSAKATMLKLRWT